MIFAVAYYRNRTARALFLVSLAAQLIISCGMLLFPGGPFAAFQMQTSSGVAAGSLADSLVSGEALAKNPAQFAGSVQPGMYAAVGVVVGLFMLLHSRRLPTRIAGSAFVTMGCYVSLVTLQRSIWIGALIGVLVLLQPSIVSRRARAVGFVLLTGLVGGLYVFLISPSGTSLALFREFLWNVGGDAYRIPVALRAFNYLFVSPLFGAAGNIWPMVSDIGGMPHQSCYYFALTYGLPAGVCVVAFYWLVLASNLPGHARSVPGLTLPERSLARSVGWIVICAALANNMAAGTLGWICLGFASLPWAYSLPATRREEVRLRNSRVFSDTKR